MTNQADHANHTKIELFEMIQVAIGKSAYTFPNCLNTTFVAYSNAHNIFFLRYDE